MTLGVGPGIGEFWIGALGEDLYESQPVVWIDWLDTSDLSLYTESGLSDQISADAIICQVIFDFVFFFRLI